MLNLHQMVCEGCSAYRPSKPERVAALSIALSPLFYALPVILELRTGFREAVFVSILISSGIIFAPILIAVHEFGHAVAAKIARETVIEVNIGSGPVIASIRWSDAPVRLRRYVFSGGRLRFVDLHSRFVRVRRAFTILGGPAANLLFAALLFWGVRTIGAPSGSAEEVLTAVPTGVGFWSGFIAIGNLVPRRGGDDETVPSDGRQILDLLKRPTKDDEGAALFVRVAALNEIGRYAQAASLALAGELNSKFGSWLLVSAVYATYRTEGPAAALDCFFWKRAEVEESSLENDEVRTSGMAWLKSTVAGCAMRTEDPKWLQLSDQLSAEAVTSLPSDAAIGGLRGSWMIRNDQVEEGLGLLTRAMRNDVNNPTRSEYCNDLAFGWRAHGDEIRASAFEDLGGYLALKI